MNNGLKIHHLDRLRKRGETPPSWMRKDSGVDGYTFIVGCAALVLVLFCIGYGFWNIANAPRDEVYATQTIERCIERGRKPVRVLDSDKNVITVRCDRDDETPR